MASSRPMPEPAPVMIATGSIVQLRECGKSAASRRTYTVFVPLSRIAIFVALALILGVPFALRPAPPAKASGPVQTLVVVTPHVPQIRAEFAAGFTAWHERRYGTPVAIDYRAPGGTSEILTQLESQYQAAAKSGQFDLSDPKNPKAAPGAIPFDV